MFKVPIGDLSQNQGVQYLFDMPVSLWTENGLLWEPSIVCAGRVYTDDVFVQTSVSDKKIKLDITLKNPTGRDRTVTLANGVQPWKDDGGSPELLDIFGEVEVTVPAGGEKAMTIEEDWEDPHLWWPDDPYLYKVVTSLWDHDAGLDRKETRFGFRDWDWSDTRLKLNGVRWTKVIGRGHYGDEETPEEGLAKIARLFSSF